MSGDFKGGNDCKIYSKLFVLVVYKERQTAGCLRALLSCTAEFTLRVCRVGCRLCAPSATTGRVVWCGCSSWVWRVVWYDVGEARFFYFFVVRLSKCQGSRKQRVHTYKYTQEQNR